MRIRSLIVIAAVALALPALAQADRKPTTKEKAQIASVIHLRVVCARVRVSTVSKKPKWGSVSWRRGGSQCDPSASDGVAVTKKTHGRWRLITAGSSFGCAELYAKVPEPVAKDLRLKCFSTPG